MKGSVFRIPPIDEVKSFMNLCKPDWPTEFIAYYAERWMLHYMANGFVVGKVKMKDWKACIRSQWLTIKYKEDKDRLESDLKSWQHKIFQEKRRRESAGMFAEQETISQGDPLERALNSLNEIQTLFKEGKVSDVQLRSACDWLRTQNMLRLPKAQIDQIKALQGNDGAYGRLLAIKQFLTNLATSGQTVKEYFKSRTQPQQS